MQHTSMATKAQQQELPVINFYAAELNISSTGSSIAPTSTSQATYAGTHSDTTPPWHCCAPEHAEPVQRGHFDDKREEVVDDGVEELVRHLAPGQVRHTLQLVVQVQLQDKKMRRQDTGLSMC
jgi:hypothetical protein